MKRLLDFIDTHLQTGTLTSVVIYVTASTILLVYATVTRENVGIAVIFAFIGLSGAWRGYLVWQRRRQQGGIDLIGTLEE